MTDLGEFFDSIWHDTEGYVYLPRKTKTASWEVAWAMWPEKRSQVVDYVERYTAAGDDVYFAPALFKDKSPKKENVIGAHVLWVDFDGNAPESWSSETQDVAGGLTEAAAVPIPTLRVQSSSEANQHVYWHLDTFETDIAYLEEKNRALAYTLGADTSGWDANQVLRPPNTTNYKNNLPVSVLEERSGSYPRTRFDFLKPAKKALVEELEFGKLIDVDDILAKYTWPENVYEAFMLDQPLPSKRTGQIDRSGALSHIAFFGAEQGMTDTEIFSLLVHADDRWGKYKGREDRIKRLSEMINRARLKHPRGINNLTFEGLSGATQTTEIQTFYNWSEYQDSDFHVDWLIDGLIEKQGLAIIASAGGVGKTQVCLRIGIAAATCTPFLRYEPLGRRKVGFLSLEMGRAAFKLFTSTVDAGLEAELRNQLTSNFTIAPLGESLDLNRSEGRAFLESAIQRFGWDLVIIDSLGKITSGEITDDTAVRGLFNYLRAVRTKYDCAFLIIHHSRKKSDNNKHPFELSDVFGSQYITSEPDTVITLYRPPGDDDIQWREVKNRLAIQRKPFVIRRTEHLGFEFVTDEGVGDNLMQKGGRASGVSNSGDNFGFA